MLSRLFFFIVLLVCLPSLALATIRNAATCLASDVNTQITASSTGDTVHLPTCSVSWSAGAISLTKAITLDGNGEANTVIDVSGTAGSITFNITKQAAGNVVIQNIKFTAANNADAVHPITVDGSWLSAEPVIFKNTTFICSVATILEVKVPGGVIFSHISFTGEWNDFFMTVKLVDAASWAAADSLGANDSTGKKNIYVEDSTFNGGSNGVYDCDDGCRIVDRHNTYNTSGGFNSHGDDSSPYGMRHFEIYNNTYNFNGAGCTGLGGDLTNINQYIWLRGATGVIFNNAFTDISSGCWGNKNEITGSIRGIEDDRPQGSCGSVSYPAPHQLGQNNNGSNDFTDPIYMWNNTGTKVFAFGFGWGNPCGFTFSDFFQSGRDYVDNGSSNSPKMGYAAYTYPHPLSGSVSCTPDHLAWDVQPSSVALGVSLGALQIGVYDSGNNKCTGDTSTVTIAKKGGTCTGMTLNETVSGAASSGTFTTSDVTLTVATGSCTLTATDGALTLADSNAFTISDVASGSGLRLRLR